MHRMWQLLNDHNHTCSAAPAIKQDYELSSQDRGLKRVPSRVPKLGVAVLLGMQAMCQPTDGVGAGDVEAHLGGDDQPDSAHKQGTYHACMAPGVLAGTATLHAS